MSEHDEGQPVGFAEEELDRAPRALSKLVSVAREDWRTPSLDVEALERRTLAAIDAEQAPARSRSRWVSGGVLVAAVAMAAGFLLVRRDPGRLATPVTPPVARTALPAGAIEATAGPVTVGGKAVATGAPLVVGDVIEVGRGAARFERPGKVRWMLTARDAEPARARVKASGETLVVELVAGTLDAEVTPVPAGEAFAVDLTEGERVVRVAVHGTHFRVARLDAHHVSVDLVEGVVAIGAPPAEGPTRGTEMVAPAHAELDIASVGESLRLDASASRVARLPALTGPLLVEPSPGAPAAPPRAPVSSAHATAPPKPPTRPSAASSTELAGIAVRDCAAQVAAKQGHHDVRVSVSSTLHLRLRPTGEVESAQFVPPLLPEVQSCAAGSIYKLRFAETGTVTIPIAYDF